jgi:hypothetical protein
MAWELKFEKVHDYVDVHVSGSGGPLISWPDRGDGGQHTWGWRDPTGEVRDISQWAGDGNLIKLFAVCIKTIETRDHQVDMEMRYSGARQQHWEFEINEEHDFWVNHVAVNDVVSGLNRFCWRFRIENKCEISINRE